MKSLTATIGPLLGRLAQQLGDERRPRRLVGMEPVPAVGLERLVAQQLVRRRAPDLGRDAALGEQLLRAQRLLHDRAAGQERGAHEALGRRRRPPARA